jgi:uncharacterized protein (DUF1015 family)
VLAIISVFMAALAPFRALRPAPASAARVAAVPYDVVTGEEARALAQREPLSFLHVSRAEIDLPPGTNPYSDEVYARAVTNMTALQAQAPFVREEAPSVYVYRMRMGAHVQTGVAACFSLDEYEANLIRRHERTRRDKEDDRTRHILELRAQTGPVFLAYRGSPRVATLVDRATRETPLFDFVAADGIAHTVWRAPEAGAFAAAFSDVPALYIADGHHRAASAARVRRHLRGGAGGRGAWDTFLAVAFPADQVQVLPYNRVVRDLGTQTGASLLDAIRRRFVVHEGPAAPARRGDVAMFVDGGWHTIVLGEAEDLPPERSLDVSRLQDAILTPLLGIADVTTDKRIDFVGGIRGTGALEAAVTSGDAAVAFSLYPVSVEDVMRVSDAGGIMPPKSTWFEPKLRDGLLIHLI